MSDILNDEKDIVLDHEADGIKELDNKLPRWWVWLFYITIIFSVIYLVYYHVLGLGRLQAERYEHEMAVAAEVYGQKPDAADLAQAVPSEPSSEDAILADGKQIFMQNCVACHTADGGGLVGPNLTDNYWIHGNTFSDSVKVIIEGVPAKGMISWKGVLSPDQIQAVASYIYTLRGTTPANPKAPEGTEYPM